MKKDRWTHGYGESLGGLGLWMEKNHSTLESHHIYYIELTREAELLYS